MTGILHPRVVAASLLESTDSFFMYVNPRVSGVCLPRHLYGDKPVMLQIGRVMSKPIVDMELTEYGFHGVLNFGGEPFKTLVPWHAVVAMHGVSPDDPVIQWPKLVEQGGDLPESFPGREKDGEGHWCPRRQRVVDDCARWSCRGAECLYRRKPDNLGPKGPRTNRIIPNPVVEERRLRSIPGGRR